MRYFTSVHPQCNSLDSSCHHLPIYMNGINGLWELGVQNTVACCTVDVKVVNTWCSVGACDIYKRATWVQVVLARFLCRSSRHLLAHRRHATSKATELFAMFPRNSIAIARTIGYVDKPITVDEFGHYIKVYLPRKHWILSNFKDQGPSLGDHTRPEIPNLL